MKDIVRIEIKYEITLIIIHKGDNYINIIYCVLIIWFIVSLIYLIPTSLWSRI